MAEKNPNDHDQIELQYSGLDRQWKVAFQIEQDKGKLKQSCTN